LIELLVVVLIIGILAAIALPQYKQSIVKSRFANIKIIMADIKRSQEMYYLVNGKYSFDIEHLDTKTTCPTISVDDGTTLSCGKYFDIDIIGQVEESAGPEHYFLQAYYCPSYAATNIAVNKCLYNAEFIYTVWFDNSSHPGIITCTGVTPVGEKICSDI
nr:hypothetical protein [Elusimicrobiaceae bacterium]